MIDWHSLTWRAFLEICEAMSPGEALLWISIGNFAIFFAALGFGRLLIAIFRRRLIHEFPKAASATEWVLAILCVAANIVITLVGFLLWQHGLIRVRAVAGWVTLLDLAVLLLAMDFAMYVTHRIAHLPQLYGVMHFIHHRYTAPRPLTLFVMNPLETLAFGVLWLSLISVYDATWLGMTIFLTLNLTFGMIGHLGVEPFPRLWTRVPLVSWISTSTFHNDHHRNKDANFGFYTIIWDVLFRTLDRDYFSDFAGAHNSAGNDDAPPTQVAFHADTATHQTTKPHRASANE